MYMHVWWIHCVQKQQLITHFVLEKVQIKACHTVFTNILYCITKNNHILWQQNINESFNLCNLQLECLYSWRWWGSDPKSGIENWKKKNYNVLVDLRGNLYVCSQTYINTAIKKEIGDKNQQFINSRPGTVGWNVPADSLALSLRGRRGITGAGLRGELPACTFRRRSQPRTAWCTCITSGFLLVNK